MRWPYLGALAGLTLAGGVLGAALGPPRAAGWGGAAGAGLGLLFWLVLPRAAHRAFVRGQLVRARALYRVLAFVVIGRRDRMAIAATRGACELASGNDPARVRLEGIDGARLRPAQRAAWLNNRAYALGRSGADPNRALALCDEAIALWGQVPAFSHTRGVILLALGKTADALSALAAAWDPARAESDFEAERCYDLACAWRRSGRADLADEYFSRAINAAPKSEWAARAGSSRSRQRAVPAFYSPGL